jgi:hypothetical protein
VGPQRLIANEVEQLDPGLQRAGGDTQAIATDTERRRVPERDLVEARVLEALAYLRHEVRRAAVAGPDHGGARRTQLPEPLDRA